MTDRTLGHLLGTALGWIILAVIALGMWGCPNYRVWQQGKEGEAELRRAEQNRQIKVQEAKARVESAVLDAESEVERAKGVAEANSIIGNSLGGHEGYLRYLWITGTFNEDSQPTVIYIPTEAGMPILEAARLTPEPAK